MASALTPLKRSITHDAVDGIETGTVDDEEYSGIEFTVNGPARLEFQWKVSSEKNYDYLVLVVDGYVRDYITGEVDWKLSSTDIGPGEHNVDIYYTKDEATAKGQDKGWIDRSNWFVQLAATTRSLKLAPSASNSCSSASAP